MTKIRNLHAFMLLTVLLVSIDVDELFSSGFLFPDYVNNMFATFKSGFGIDSTNSTHSLLNVRDIYKPE